MFHWTSPQTDSAADNHLLPVRFDERCGEVVRVVKSVNDIHLEWSRGQSGIGHFCALSRRGGIYWYCILNYKTYHFWIVFFLIRVTGDFAEFLVLNSSYIMGRDGDT